MKTPLVSDYLDQADKQFPNRHNEIHKVCCKKCPSNHNKKNGNVDEESEQIKTFPKELIAKEYLFVCAWRPNKLCKAICDYYDIDENYLKTLNESTKPKS